jgi:hypothetical protein
MHSEAATIGEIVHPIAGSTARGTVAIAVVGAVVGSGTGGNVTTLASFARRHFARSRSRWEAAGIAAELDLVEQLSAASAPFRPTARQIVGGIVGRAGLWSRGASLRRRAELQPLPDAARTEPGLSGDVADGGSSLTQSMDLIKDGLPRVTMRLAGQVSCSTTSPGPPEPHAIVAGSSSLDSGNKARPVDRSARLSWVSIVSRKSCRRWNRSATCRA